MDVQKEIFISKIGCVKGNLLVKENFSLKIVV